LTNDDVRSHKTLEDMDTNNLDRLKNAVGDGTYVVAAEEVAARLVDYMLQLWDSKEIPLNALTTELESGVWDELGSKAPSARRSSRKS
jgi:Anti-sigma-28 factor, FlgM